MPNDPSSAYYEVEAAAIDDTATACNATNCLASNTYHHGECACVYQHTQSLQQLHDCSLALEYFMLAAPVGAFALTHEAHTPRYVDHSGSLG